MAIGNVAPRFSDKDLKIIADSLPAPRSKRRQELLPQILREWCHVDLPRHFSMEGQSAIRTRVKNVAKVGKLARELSQAFEEIDDHGRRRIVYLIAEGEQKLDDRAEWTNIDDQLSKTREFLIRLATIEPKVPDFGPGQPKKILPYLVLKDVAAIFEWYTGSKATRRVDRNTGEGIGPFWQFASALWPILFGNDTEGLPAAMKNWASWRSRFDEISALIANIDLRHPTWGVFDTDD